MEGIAGIKADIFRIGPFFVARCSALDSRTTGLTEDEAIRALRMKINREWGGIFSIDIDNT